MLDVGGVGWLRVVYREVSEVVVPIPARRRFPFFIGESSWLLLFRFNTGIFVDLARAEEGFVFVSKFIFRRFRQCAQTLRWALLSCRGWVPFYFHCARGRLSVFWPVFSFLHLSFRRSGALHCEFLPVSFPTFSVLSEGHQLFKVFGCWGIHKQAAR